MQMKKSDMHPESQHIELKGLRLYAYHGVCPQERIVGSWYTLDIEVTADVSAAVSSDCVDDTINYAEIAQIARTEMKTPSDLLEHVAGRIAEKLQERFTSLQSVRISLTKENPPVGSECRAATVTLKYVQ